MVVTTSLGWSGRSHDGTPTSSPKINLQCLLVLISSNAGIIIGNHCSPSRVVYGNCQISVKPPHSTLEQSKTSRLLRNHGVVFTVILGSLVVVLSSRARDLRSRRMDEIPSVEIIGTHICNTQQEAHVQNITEG